MPGNTVKINNFNGLEYYVGDSKMEGLMAYLNKHGHKEEKFTSMIESIILCQECKQPLTSVGGESGEGQNGFNEHFFCQDCGVGINVMITYSKAEKTNAEVVKNE